MSEQKELTRWLIGLSVLLILTSTMFVVGAIIGSPFLFGIGLPAACFAAPFTFACALDWHKEYKANHPKISYAQMARELGYKAWSTKCDRWWSDTVYMTAVGPHGLKKAYKLHQKGLKKAGDKLVIKKATPKKEPQPDNFEFLQPMDRAWYDGQMAFVREVGEEAKKDLSEIMAELEDKIKRDIEKEERKAKEEERKAFLAANPDLAKKISDIKEELKDLADREERARNEADFYEKEYKASLSRSSWSHHLSNDYYKTYRRYYEEELELEAQIHKLVEQRDELEAQICK